MKFATYLSTPGLDRVPEQQRSEVWLSANKKLMTENPDYRLRVQCYPWFILWMTAVQAIVAPLAQSIVSMIAMVAMFVGYTFLIIRFSNALQQYRNEQIGRILENTSADGVLASNKNQ
jgi:hypothetical protein